MSELADMALMQFLIILMAPGSGQFSYLGRGGRFTVMTKNQHIGLAWIVAIGSALLSILPIFESSVAQYLIGWFGGGLSVFFYMRGLSRER
jgi:hypothetical protein